MAKKTVETYFSDLSGVELGTNPATLSFSFKGSAYDIDLTHDEAAEFEATIARYVSAARPVASRRPAAKSRSTSGHDPKEVRHWARENGYSVPERGRIPGDIIAAFESAH